MRFAVDITTADVAEFYGSDSISLFELVLGEQLHLGGLDSTLDLARRAGIGDGQVGIDLCCCTGAGMRALVRLCGVSSMTGVDITPEVIERGRRWCQRDGVAGRVEYLHVDATATGLPDDCVDFVWSEDAWVHVPDKAAIVAEAARLVRPSGVIAFTDFVEGPAGLRDDEADQFMEGLYLPSVATIDDYVGLLQSSGLDVVAAEDTDVMAAAMQLAAEMIRGPLRYDALRRVNFDADRYESTAAGYGWVAELARANKLAQARFIARPNR